MATAIKKSKTSPVVDAACSVVSVRREVIDVMELLTHIPQGGIGEQGATMAEIEAAESAGRCVEDDETYHVVQKAWWKLRLLLP